MNLEKVLIKNKKTQTKVSQFNTKYVSNFFSVNRFYTILNQYSEDVLSQHSKLLYFIICYFFRSSNFRHNNEARKKIKFFIWALDVFCWICIIGFFACLIAGIANPLVTAVTSIASAKFNDAAIAIQQAFSSGTAIGLLLTSMFCLLVTLLYRFLWKKIIQVNKSLTLENFVVKKISLLNSLDFLIKSADVVSKSTNQNKNINLNYVVLTNLEDFNNDDSWKVLQAFNIMVKLFENFNLFLVFNKISDQKFYDLQKIIQLDFHNIEICQYC